MVYLIPTPGILVTPDEVIMIDLLLEHVDYSSLSDENKKFFHDLRRDLKNVSLNFVTGSL